jgi:hypothetical protein
MDTSMWIFIETQLEHRHVLQGFFDVHKWSDVEWSAIFDTAFEKETLPIADQFCF